MTNIEKLSQYTDQYLDGIYNNLQMANLLYQTVLRMSVIDIIEMNKRLKLSFVYALMQRYEGETCLIKITTSEIEAKEWENRNDDCIQWSERYELK